MSDNYFMGLDGFVWFTGVVEDRNDPFKIGRVRVRCLGYHTPDKEKIPTEDLPWAYPVLPLNSPSKIFGLKPGTRVLGFFRDGANAQDRVMLGAINTGENDVKSSYIEVSGGLLGTLMAAAGPAAGLAPFAGSVLEKSAAFSDVAAKVSESLDEFKGLVGEYAQKARDLADDAFNVAEGVIDAGGDFLESALEGVVEQADVRASIVESATETITKELTSSASDLLEEASNKIDY